MYAQKAKAVWSGKGEVLFCKGESSARSGDRREVYGQEFKYLERGNCKRLVRGKCIRWGEDALDCPAGNIARSSALSCRTAPRTTQRSSASFCRTTRGQRLRSSALPRRTACGQRCARPLRPAEPPRGQRSARPLRPAELPCGQRSARLLRSVEPSCGRHCACLLCLTELLLFFYSFIRNIAALVPARGSSPCTPGKRLRLLHLFCCRVFFGGLFSITKGL